MLNSRWDQNNYKLPGRHVPLNDVARSEPATKAAVTFRSAKPQSDPHTGSLRHLSLSSRVATQFWMHPLQKCTADGIAHRDGCVSSGVSGTSLVPASGDRTSPSAKCASWFN